MASRIQFSSLRSKVGRRFFYLFVVCAILPLTILALISYYQVSGQLRDQATQRLEQLSKNQGMVIYERLLHLQKELERTGRDNHQETPSDSPSLWKKGFDSISLLNQIGVTPLIGEPLMPPILSGKQKMALAAEKAILFQGNASQETPGIFMAVASGPGSILIGEINTDYLWGQGPLNELPFSTELTILDEDNRVLFSSVGAPFELLDKVQKGSAGSFQWKFQEGSYIAGLWPLFIKGNFHPPQWIIVLSQPESKVFGPMNEFMKLFPPVVLTTFWTVLLVSMIFIRKHLTPLEKLKAGTKEIARRDFQARIDVQSNDEFQELAESFNSMAGELGRHFQSLHIRGEIDRAVLSTLDREKIVEIVHEKIGAILRSDAVAVCLFEAKGNAAEIFRSGGKSVKIPVLAGELKNLEQDRSDYQVYSNDGSAPSLVHALFRERMEQFLLLPLFIQERLAGLIGLGFRTGTTPADEDLLLVRRLADQVGVAFSNALLMEELNHLSEGSMRALARTVDAKSPWTAGHSERVTEIALRIGREMGLQSKELEDIRRAGLLHDVGKIGISNSILDKPSRLEEWEFAIIRKHPQMGARILEPISSFENSVAIILQHHERMDGSGYPMGLSGDSIVLGARIMAVADVFDALTSDRPYRPGWERDKAVSYIQNESGSFFDQEVVDAFLRILSKEDASTRPL